MRLFIALLILLIYLPIISSAALPEDPAFDKPVTLAVKGESLSDVIRMLQEKTGVWLRVSRDIADQKVTIFVDEKPLRDIMGGLSKLFSFVWREKTLNEHPVHELYEPEAAKRERIGRLNKASDAAWVKLLADIKFRYELTGKTEVEIDQQLKADSEDELMADDELRRMAVENLKDPETKLMLRFVSSLPDDVLMALRSGNEVYFDSASPEVEWRLPEDLTAALITEQTELTEPVAVEITETTDEVDTDEDSIELEYANDDSGDELDPEQVEDEFPLSLFRGHDDVNMQPDRVNLKLYVKEWPGELSLSYSALFFAGDKYHSRSGFTICGVQSYKIRAIEKPELPKALDSELMSKKVSLTRAELLKEANLPKHLSLLDSNGEINRSDVLALLHRKLGLQVIADHYTDWRCIPEGSNPTLRGVLDYLAMKNGPMGPGRSDYQSSWGADSQFVYFRIDDPVSADPWEVPNRLLRPWQEKYARNHMLDLNDYAQIALLSPEQGDMITSSCQRLRVGHSYTFGMSMYGFENSNTLLELPVLRLYGLLSQRQRKEAALKGTLVAAFTADQRAALHDVITRQQHLQNSPDTNVRVGIYRFGVRLDKPGPEPQDDPQPTLFEFRLSRSNEGYCREVSSKFTLDDGHEGETTSSVKVKASSFEEVWEKVKDKMPATDKYRLYYDKTQIYRAKVTFEDGSTLGTWPEIRSHFTFEDYEVEQKSKQQ